jgi:hypothetical protein
MIPMLMIHLCMVKTAIVDIATVTVVDTAKDIYYYLWLMCRHV